MSAGMPPPAPTVRSALDSLAVRFVLAQRALGYDQAQVEAQLRTRYSGMSLQTARAIYARAVRAEGAAEWLHILPGTPLEARDVDRPLPGQTWWRYTLRVLWETASGHTQAMLFTYNSPNSLSGAQVQQDVLTELAQWQADQQESRNPNYDTEGGMQSIQTQILGVERATPVTAP